jgi:hypothetical protein
MADEGVRSLAPNRPRIISRHTLDRPDGDPTSSGMSTPDRKGLDIEAILNDLYASEINASISWIWGGGFHLTLGAPQIQGYALPTIRDAVLSLRDKSLRAFPDSDFARKYGGFV